MSSRIHVPAPIGVAALAFVLLLPGVFFGLSPAIGKAAMGASRVLDGDVPYRDFWTMYSPGHFYLGAALMGVFGRELVVLGIAACVLRAVSAALIFALGRRLGASAHVAFAIACVFAVTSFELTPELTGYIAALPCLLGACWFVLDAVATERASRWWLAGIALGVASWFKHDVAAYCALACAVVPFACVQRISPRGAAWAGFARMALGALAVATPVYAMIAWFGGADAWRDLIVFPAGDFRAVRGQAYTAPFPAWGAIAPWMRDPASLVKARNAVSSVSNWILCTAPEIAFAAGLVWFARAHRKLDRASFAGAVLVLAMIPPYWAAAHVQQNTHVITMALASLLLCALAWRSLEPSQLLARRAFVAIACFHGVGLALAPAQSVYRFTMLLWRNVPLEVPGAALVRVSPKEHGDLSSLVAFVRASTNPNEPIHVGVARHDAVVIGSPHIYFLCDRPPATRYQELHPGIADRIDIQREMIADLDAKHLRCAILWRFGWPDDVLDGILRRRMERVPGTGAKLLDEYFATQFEPVFERGEYVVLWRRGEPRPRAQ